jgi:pimeloyl-ACP methyl ester carboxylesterase
MRPEHAKYLARTSPGGTLTILPGVSHFAPLQRPDRFNAAVLAFPDGCRAGLSRARAAAGWGRVR